MTPFLILSSPGDCEESMAVVARVRDELLMPQSQWAVLLDERRALVAIKRGGRALEGRVEAQATFIIGDLFRRGEETGRSLLSSSRSFDELCAKLASDFWGAYLAVQLDRHGGMRVFRDPVGMRDGVSWSRSGVRLITSDPSPWLSLVPPVALTIDWARIGELLDCSSGAAEATPLAAVETIEPGTMIEFGNGKRRSDRLWCPRQFYGDGENACATAAELKHIVTACVEAWIKAYPNNMLELSGGFDSAVVAAAGRRFGYGINFYSGDFAGDERRYARDLADCHGINLSEFYMPVGQLIEADLEGMPVGVRPGIGSATLFHDQPLAAFARARDVDALFTGHGGDAIFFQHPTATIASDPAFPRFDLAAYADLARWNRTSAWDVARHAFGLPLGAPSNHSDSAMAQLPLARPFRGSGLEWASDLVGIPPAKRAQILAIAGDRSAFGPSWRSRAMTVVHPLLSQPLIEHVIAIDAYLVTKGKRDRAIAREAFGDTLPASISARKGKGSLSHFFGRSLAASTSFLRSYLLDGLIVGQGILDRTRLEMMLDRDYLMRFDCYAKLLSALILEHWTRAWTDRLDAAPPIAAVSRDRHGAV